MGWGTVVNVRSLRSRMQGSWRAFRRACCAVLSFVVQGCTIDAARVLSTTACLYASPGGSPACLRACELPVARPLQGRTGLRCWPRCKKMQEYMHTLS